MEQELAEGMARGKDYGVTYEDFLRNEKVGKEEKNIPALPLNIDINTVAVLKKRGERHYSAGIVLKLLTDLLDRVRDVSPYLMHRDVIQCLLDHVAVSGLIEKYFIEVREAAVCILRRLIANAQCMHAALTLQVPVMISNALSAPREGVDYKIFGPLQIALQIGKLYISKSMCNISCTMYSVV